MLKTENGVTTVFIGNYCEWTGTITDTIKYYYAGSERVALRRGAGETSPLTWLLGDHLGSTSVSYDGTQALHQGYMPWGETRFGGLNVRYQFTGQAREESFGLDFYNARWYDSYLSRWTSPDSIVPLATQGIQALDRYAYVNNNPIRFIDPYGFKLPDGRDAGEVDDCLDGKCSSADDPFTKEELVDAISFETGLDKELIKNLTLEDLDQAYNDPTTFLEQYTYSNNEPNLFWLAVSAVVLTVGAMITEVLIIEAEIALAGLNIPALATGPFAPLIEGAVLGLHLRLFGVGIAVGNITIAYDSYVYRRIVHPDAPQEFYWLPPWGL